MNARVDKLRTQGLLKAWHAFEADDRFERAGPGSLKVRCRVCGTTGWAVNEQTSGRNWMTTHRRDHHPCPDCGKMLVCYPSGAPRVHTRCRMKNDPISDEAEADHD